jgi:hypothetical protein
MEAAGQDGIPTAFIVNTEGKIAWIGHPQEMEKPLEEILGGKYDLKAAAAKLKKEKEAQAKLQELGNKLREAQQSGEPKKVLAVIEKALEETPELEERLGMMKFQLLTQQADAKDKALEYGTRLTEKLYKDNAQALNNIAWMTVDPNAAVKPDAKLLKLALTAAQRADELTQSKDPGVLDTLAKAYYDNGDAAKALEIQEKAVKFAKGTRLEQDQSMKDRLALYRKAVKKE